MTRRLKAGEPAPRGAMPQIMRGLNRVFTGMLVQNQDELVLATSGSHSQSKTSPLLDELISVPRQGGEEVAIERTAKGGVGLAVRLSKGDDPGVIRLPLTPPRFAFLDRVRRRIGASVHPPRDRRTRVPTSCDAEDVVPCKS